MASTKSGQCWRLKDAVALPDGKGTIPLGSSIIVVVLDEAEIEEAGRSWNGSNLAMVLPISTETEFQGRNDLLVPASESPIGEGFIVLVECDLLVTTTALDALLGELTDEQWDDLAILYDDARGAFRREEDEWAQDILDEMDRPARILTDDDPRVAFREREEERFRLLKEAREVFCSLCLEADEV